MKESTVNNRKKKAEARAERELRKSKHKKVEKKKNPSNLLICLLIIIVIGGIFGGLNLQKWYKKPATIQSYLDKKDNKEMKKTKIDEFSTMYITSKKNDMKIVVAVDTSKAKKAEKKQTNEYYNNKENQKNIKFMSAYYLTDIKPQTRAIKASVKYDIQLDKKSIKSETLTYKEAKKFIEKQQEQAAKEQTKQQKKKQNDE